MTAEAQPVVPNESDLLVLPSTEEELAGVYDSVDSVFQGIIEGNSPQNTSKYASWEHIDDETVEVVYDKMPDGGSRYSAVLTRRSVGAYDVSMTALKWREAGLQGIRLDFGLNKYGFGMPGESVKWTQDRLDGSGLRRPVENSFHHELNTPVAWARDLKNLLEFVATGQPPETSSSPRERIGSFIAWIFRQK